jgi:Calcineurin-like phosphoesterase
MRLVRLLALALLVLGAGAAPARAELVAAVGDGADRQLSGKPLADHIARRNPDRFIYLGDVYDTGTATEFREGYERTYGQLAHKTDPVIGNHDFGNRDKGYYPYWNGKRGWSPETARHRSYVTPEGWQLIFYNSEETTPGEPEWVAGEMAKHHGTCRIVAAHQARHTLVDTSKGDALHQDRVWEAMKGTTAINLVAHTHLYGRLVPIDGINVIVSGAGGHSLRSMVEQHHAVAAVKAMVPVALFLDLQVGRAAFTAEDPSGNVVDSGIIPCTPPPGVTGESGTLPSRDGLAPPPGLAADRLAPRLAVRHHSRSLRTARRRGVAISARCTEACLVTLTLRVDRRTAQRLRLPRVIGRGSISVAGPRAGRSRVRLKASVRRRLRGARSLAATLEARAVDRAGNATSTTRRIRLR